MSPQRLTRPAALGLTLAALAAPATAGAQDLRSPDAGFTGAPQAVTIGADLRSPDAGFTGAPLAVTVGADLRSPDTHDAVDGRGTFSAPDVMVVELDRPAAPAPAADGMDWTDAGIGAGVLLGLSVLAVGGVIAVMHRRGPATPV